MSDTDRVERCPGCGGATSVPPRTFGTPVTCPSCLTIWVWCGGAEVESPGRFVRIGSDLKAPRVVPEAWRATSRCPMCRERTPAPSRGGETTLTCRSCGALWMWIPGRLSNSPAYRLGRVVRGIIDLVTRTHPPGGRRTTARRPQGVLWDEQVDGPRWIDRT